MDIKMTDPEKADENLELVGIDHIRIFDLETEVEIVNQRGSSLTNEVKDDE